MPYLFHLLGLLAIYWIASLGLAFLVGSTGRLSLAQAASFACGAYAYALSRLRWATGFSGGLLTALAASAVLGAVIALPARRLRGDHYVLLSLVVYYSIASILRNWFAVGPAVGTWTNLTNGPFGISGIPGPAIGDSTVASPIPLGGLYLAAAIGVALGAVWLLRSPWNRALRAMRDDELAAFSLGKPVHRLLIESSTLCSALAGLAGALYAARVGSIDPSICTLDSSVFLLACVIVGGSGTSLGPALGVVLFLIIPEVLLFVPLPSSVAANARPILFGVLLVLIVHLRPRGLLGAQRVG